MLSTAGQRFSLFDRFLRKYFPSLFAFKQRRRSRSLWYRALHTPESELRRNIDPFEVRYKYNL